MGIAIRVLQKGVDPVDEEITDGMLHMLRLFVDLIPREVERLDEEQLDQPVTTQHAQGEFAPLRRQRDPFVRAIVCQARFRERLEHAGDRARRHRQFGCQLTGGYPDR